jgi:hypothetical protein
MDEVRNYQRRFMEIMGYNYGNAPQLNETTQITLVKNIQSFLDRNYERGEETEITPDGKFTSKKVIGVKANGDGGKKEIATNISPMDLFYRVEEQFKNEIEKSDKRTVFLKQNIIDWYNKHAGVKDGNLSKNLST